MTLGGFTSENSLDIRSDSMSGIYGERSQVEAGGGDIGEGGTPAIKNVKLETLQHNMGSTPTEMNDFLAMLDDKTTYSEVIQLTEPNMSSERPQSMDYNTGSELSFNGRDMIGAGSPMGSYPNSQRISNRSSRDHTLNYSEPEPGDSGELGETMDPLTAIASASISSVPGSEQHSRVPQVQRMTQQPQTTENSMQKTTLNSTSIQDFLDNIDNSQSEEQYINPYLLNKEMNGAGVGPSLFMDSGTDIDNNKTNDDTNPMSENPMMLEDLTVSPQPVFSDRRRMSEVASEKVGYRSGPRGSISHQVDFWNLSSAGSSNPPLLNMSPNKSAQLQQENNSELFDLMSFKKKGRQQSLQQQKMHNPTTQQQKDLQHGDLQQTQQQQQQQQQQQMQQLQPLQQQPQPALVSAQPPQPPIAIAPIQPAVQILPQLQQHQIPATQTVPAQVAVPSSVPVAQFQTVPMVTQPSVPESTSEKSEPALPKETAPVVATKIEKQPAVTAPMMAPSSELKKTDSEETPSSKRNLEPSESDSPGSEKKQKTNTSSPPQPVVKEANAELEPKEQKEENGQMDEKHEIKQDEQPEAPQEERITPVEPPKEAEKADDEHVEKPVQSEDSVNQKDVKSETDTAANPVSTDSSTDAPVTDSNTEETKKTIDLKPMETEEVTELKNSEEVETKTEPDVEKPVEKSNDSEPKVRNVDEDEDYDE